MVKTITPKGTGFKDYTDVLHRVAVETHIDQNFWQFCYGAPPNLVTIDTNTWVEIDIPVNIPAGYELIVNTISVSISSNRMIETMIYDTHSNLLDDLISFQNTIFHSKEGLKFNPGDVIRLLIKVYSKTADTVYLTVYAIGIYQYKGVTVL